MKRSRLVDELDGCVKLFEIFGMQFFSLKTIFIKDYKHWSTYRIIYFIILCASCLAFGCLFIAQTIAVKVTTENILTTFFFQLINYLFLSAFASNFIRSAIFSEDIRQFFLTSHKISDICEKELKKTFNYAELRKTITKKIRNIIAISVAAAVATFYTQFTNLEIELFVATGLIIFLTVTACRYSFFVIFVNFQLHYIEDIFCSTFQIKYAPTYGKVYRIEVNANPEKDELQKMKIIWKMYIKVCENVSTINKSMGITMLFVVVIELMVITYTLYDVCLAILDDSQAQLSKTTNFFLRKYLF